MSGVSDDVKARLRRIANSTSEEEIQTAIKDLKEWDRYNGKVKAWFEGKHEFCMNIFFNTRNGVIF